MTKKLTITFTVILATLIIISASNPSSQSKISQGQTKNGKAQLPNFFGSDCGERPPYSHISQIQNITLKYHTKSTNQTNFSLREILKQSEIKFIKIIKSVDDHFQHDQEVYQTISEIIKTIKKNTLGITNLNQIKIIFIIGPPGAGKSTLINYLVSSDDNFIVKNNDAEITTKQQGISVSEIGGQHSTTFFPILVNSEQIGQCLDCAGDGDTGGIIIDVINSIVKQKISSQVNEAKIIFVTPYSALKGTSGYGSTFKQSLDQNLQFIGDIKHFKDSFGFVVTSAPQKPQSKQNPLESTLSKTKAIISKVMSQPDMDFYRQSINKIVQNGKIAIFSRPNSQLQVNDIYAPPEWNPDQRKNIIDMINSIDYVKIPRQNFFNVSTSTEMREALQKSLIVVQTKIRNVIEEIIQKALPIKIYSVELQTFMMFVDNLIIGKQTSLLQFVQILKYNNFLKIQTDSSQIQRLDDQINFLNRFTKSKQNSQNESLNKLNWSKRLGISHRLNPISEQARTIMNTNKNSFLLQIKENIVQTQYQMPELGSSIKSNIDKLDKTYRQLQKIILEGKIESSEYYRDEIRKQFSHKGIQSYTQMQKYLKRQPYQEWKQATYETYIDYVTKSKPVTKVKQETYTENQIVYNPVTKTRQQPYIHMVSRRNTVMGIVVSPTYYPQTRYKEVKYQESVPQVKTVNKTRRVQYIDYQNYTQAVEKVRQKTPRQLVTLQRQVQSQREVTKQRQIDVLRDVKIRVLDKEKYQFQVKICQNDIQNLRQTIDNHINSYPQGNLKYCKNPEINTKDQIEQKYKDLLEKWRDAQYKAYFHMNPNNSLKQCNIQSTHPSI